MHPPTKAKADLPHQTGPGIERAALPMGAGSIGGSIKRCDSGRTGTGGSVVEQGDREFEENINITIGVIRVPFINL